MRRSKQHHPPFRCDPHLLKAPEGGDGRGDIGQTPDNSVTPAVVRELARFEHQREPERGNCFLEVRQRLHVGKVAKGYARGRKVELLNQLVLRVQKEDGSRAADDPGGRKAGQSRGPHCGSRRPVSDIKHLDDPKRLWRGLNVRSPRLRARTEKEGGKKRKEEEETNSKVLGLMYVLATGRKEGAENSGARPLLREHRARRHLRVRSRP